MIKKIRLFPISATKSGKWVAPWGHKFNTEKELKDIIDRLREEGLTP